jgi:signal transduction histidine kinase
MRRHLDHQRQINRPHYLDSEWADDDVESPRLAKGTVEMDKLAPAEVDGNPSELVEIVHDLKNPLSTIALELCLLDEKLADPTPADMRAGLARVQHNVAYLDRLVQDILDSCALHTNRFELQRRPVEVVGLVEQVLERAVPTRDRWRVYLDASVRVLATIDELRIERVVANLLHNALKYSPPGTGIVVRIEVEPRIRVSVIDAGAGLSAADAAHVFDKYWRAPTTKAREGSGLGLYVARRIIEEHGGTMGVHSIPAVGSRFFFELPRT